MKILREGYLNETESRFYFQQLFCGIEYLHSMGVTHNNLRCENLLLHPDGQLKITDFTMSSILENEQHSNLSGFTSSSSSKLSSSMIAGESHSSQRQDHKEEMPTPTHTSRLTSDPSVATPMITMTNSRCVSSPRTKAALPNPPSNAAISLCYPRTYTSMNIPLFMFPNQINALSNTKLSILTHPSTHP